MLLQGANVFLFSRNACPKQSRWHRRHSCTTHPSSKYMFSPMHGAVSQYWHPPPPPPPPPPPAAAGLLSAHAASIAIEIVEVIPAAGKHEAVEGQEMSVKRKVRGQGTVAP